jgi:hypothetical protein
LSLLHRRQLLIGAAALSLAGRARAALPIPADNAIRFKVIRSGSEIGHHDLTFVRNGDALTVKVDVAIAVYVAFVRIFHYSHHNIETWQGDLFTGFDAQTDDDGTRYKTSGRRNDGGIAVTGSKIAAYTAPAAVLCATHWNKAQLDGPMINPQDGKMLHPTIVKDGPGQVALANRQTVSAERYTLTGDMRLVLWYADDVAWTALSFAAPDGSLVEYRRT